MNTTHASPPPKKARLDDDLPSRPTNLEDCYLDGICTYVVTGKKYLQQRWVTLPDFPTNEGFCLVCAKKDFSNRKDEFIQRTGTFFCDWGEQGKSSCLPDKFAGEESQDGEFIVDPKLKLETRHLKYCQQPDFIINALAKQDRDVVLDHDLMTDSKHYFHSNYANYLRLCWDTHAGIVIIPDHFWFVVACQLAKHIHKHAEDYRQYFTETDSGKTQLTFVVPDPTNLDINLIVAELKRRVPGIDTSLFLPKFSTSDNNSQLAIAACFCEAMEAYYSYCTSRCGISKVRVTGTPNDWQLMARHCDQLAEFLNADGCDLYLRQLAKRFREISQFNRNTWTNFFKIVDCGSGSDDIVNGWVRELYSLTAEFRGYRDDYGAQFDGCSLKQFRDGSEVNYTFIDTGEKFRKCFGLQGCRLNDQDYLVPQFHQVRLRLASDEEKEAKMLEQFSPDARLALTRLRCLDTKTKQDIMTIVDIGSYKICGGQVESWFLDELTEEQIARVQERLATETDDEDDL